MHSASFVVQSIFCVLLSNIDVEEGEENKDIEEREKERERGSNPRLQRLASRTDQVSVAHDHSAGSKESASWRALEPLSDWHGRFGITAPLSLSSQPNWPCQSERSCKARHEADSFEPAEWSEPQWFSVAPFAHKRKMTKFPFFWCLVFGAQFQHFLEFFCPFFCFAASSCVYEHSHPYPVSECLFLAENKAFPYPRRVRAHPRRVRTLLWDVAATCSVVIFVVVAAKKRSPNLSVSRLTLYGLVDRLPVSAGKFRRALQRHFSVDFQTEDIAGKIFSCSKLACFAFVNRAKNGWTAFARILPTHRFHD